MDKFKKKPPRERVQKANDSVSLRLWQVWSRPSNSHPCISNFIWAEIFLRSGGWMKSKRSPIVGNLWQLSSYSLPYRNRQKKTFWHIRSLYKGLQLFPSLSQMMDQSKRRHCLEQFKLNPHFHGSLYFVTKMLLERYLVDLHIHGAYTVASQTTSYCIFIEYIVNEWKKLNWYTCPETKLSSFILRNFWNKTHITVGVICFNFITAFLFT